MKKSQKHLLFRRNASTHPRRKKGKNKPPKRFKYKVFQCGMKILEFFLLVFRIVEVILNFFKN